jgi:uncharacterized protein YodC (DUF2158 family)
MVEDTLEVCPIDRPCLSFFKEGTLVRQKCGGPVMVVVLVDGSFPCFPPEFVPAGAVFCAWVEDSVRYEHFFSIYALDVFTGKTSFFDTHTLRE